MASGLRIPDRVRWARIWGAVVLSSLGVSFASMGAGASQPEWPPWDYSIPPARLTAQAGLHQWESAGGTGAACVESTPGTASIAAVAAIRFYQVILSKPYNTAFNPGGCPFTPTCSEYGLGAFRGYGIPRAVLMTGDRLMRCHPAAILNGYELDDSGKRVHLQDPPCWLGCAGPSGALAP